MHDEFSIPTEQIKTCFETGVGLSAYFDQAKALDEAGSTRQALKFYDEIRIEAYEAGEYLTCAHTMLTQAKIYERMGSRASPSRISYAANAGMLFYMEGEMDLVLQARALTYD